MKIWFLYRFGLKIIFELKRNNFTKEKMCFILHFVYHIKKWMVSQQFTKDMDYFLLEYMENIPIHNIVLLHLDPLLHQCGINFVIYWIQFSKISSNRKYKSRWTYFLRKYIISELIDFKSKTDIRIEGSYHIEQYFSFVLIFVTIGNNWEKEE